MTRRGIPLATASVVPTIRNPARSNIDLVPTNAIVRSIRPGGSTDRMRLHGRRTVRGGIGHRTFDQGCRHALTTMAGADHDAHDAPYRQVVDRPDETRASQTRDLGAGTDVAPSHRLAVPVGHHPWRMFTLAQAPHCLFAVSATELLDLTSPQPVRQAPAVVGAASAVDDVSEVLEPVRRHRVCLPGHGATPSRPADTGADPSVDILRLEAR